jgi:hypothetical protein
VVCAIARSPFFAESVKAGYCNHSAAANSQRQVIRRRPEQNLAKGSKNKKFEARNSKHEARNKSKLMKDKRTKQEWIRFGVWRIRILLVSRLFDFKFVSVRGASFDIRISDLFRWILVPTPCPGPTLRL